MSDILFPAQSNYLNNLIVETDPLLIEMAEFANLNKIPILELCSAQFLEQMVKIKKPKYFLEIGMAIGYSTIRVAKSTENGTNIETIEKSNDNIRLANEFVKRSGYLERIKILKGEAKEILSRLDCKYDFIFLDADKEDYLELFDLAVKLLVKDGIIIIDNLLWKGYAASSEVPDKYKKSTEFIRKFNAQFFNSKELNSSIIPIGDGIGLGIKL